MGVTSTYTEHVHMLVLNVKSLFANSCRFSVPSLSHLIDSPVFLRFFFSLFFAGPRKILSCDLADVGVLQRENKGMRIYSSIRRCYLHVYVY